jgi:hypothetical protein
MARVIELLLFNAKAAILWEEVRFWRDDDVSFVVD